MKEWRLVLLEKSKLQHQGNSNTNCGFWSSLHVGVTEQAPKEIFENSNFGPRRNWWGENTDT